MVIIQWLLDVLCLGKNFSKIIKIDKARLAAQVKS